MSRILLVDDSPHAQRMGEKILADEGYEVVTVSNADSALIRLEDVDPDVVLADTVMPGRTGFDICHFVKMSPRHRHVKVILTAGVRDSLDEEQARRVEADGSLKKPFEASALLAAVKPLAAAAAEARAKEEPAVRKSGARTGELAASDAPFVAVVDAEQVRAAVTIALDAAMSTMVDEIALQVIHALRSAPEPVPAAADERPAEPAESPASQPALRVPPMPPRATSILGLNLTDAPSQPSSSE